MTSPANIYLHGIGHFHPETILDNKFFVDLDIGVDENWILENVGIVERRTILDLDYIRKTRNSDIRASHEASLYSNTQTGCFAAEMALSRANLQASDIGMVIAGGSCQQHSAPAEACFIAAQLGIRAPSFDINSACATFAVQLWLLSNWISSELQDFVLLVHSENLTRTLNYNDLRTSILLGDASTAAVVSMRVPSPVVIRCVAPGSDPCNSDKIRIPTHGYLHMDGRAVQASVMRVMCSLAEALREPSDRTDKIHFIGTQANKIALNTVRKRLQIQENNHLFNVDRFGNCGAAGGPSVLSQNWERLQSDDSVLVAIVGSGLTWGSFRVDFRAA